MKTIWRWLQRAVGYAVDFVTSRKFPDTKGRVVVYPQDDGTFSMVFYLPGAVGADSCWHVQDLKLLQAFFSEWNFDVTDDPAAVKLYRSIKAGRDRTPQQPILLSEGDRHFG